MSNVNEAIRTQVMGTITEKNIDYLAIAKKVEEQTKAALRSLVEDDNEEIRAIKIMGVTLALLDADDLF